MGYRRTIHYKPPFHCKEFTAFTHWKLCLISRRQVMPPFSFNCKLLGSRPIRNQKQNYLPLSFFIVWTCSLIIKFCPEMLHLSPIGTGPFRSQFCPVLVPVVKLGWPNLRIAFAAWRITQTHKGSSKTFSGPKFSPFLRLITYS